MQGLEDTFKRGFGGGHGHQVEMIAHQTIGHNLHGVLLTIPRQPRQVEFTIVVG